MTNLILGVILWSGFHLFKRLFPEARAKMGTRGKAFAAIGILAGLVLMVIGYREADGAFFWGRHPATAGINNLLMLLSVYLFAVSGMQTRLARRMRHPMLAGVKVWALGHLLVNGDVPSFVLFGGLLAWAVVEMIAINRAEPEWTPPPPAPMSREVIAVVATVVIYGAITFIHTWLGYYPFG
ncbi:NnrU family protein [Sediminimonas sp.]|uniref:NnrU family protein n=1 Tax=Sediminimonas sp. TaxID=2823379 RepID=UPI0025D76DD2|nr:NnrU family protein [Sediminimonas sp.]